jgi:hypothetical protein
MLAKEHTTLLEDTYTENENTLLHVLQLHP